MPGAHSRPSHQPVIALRPPSATPLCGAQLYVDHGVSGGLTKRPEFDRALEALHQGDTLVVTTLDRLGRSRANMLALADTLRGRGMTLRVLNLGGGNVDTGTPMVFMVMAALAQMELEIKRERVNDSNTTRRAAGMDLGGRRETFSDRQIGNTRRLIDQGQPASHVARDLGMSRTTLYRRINNLEAREWLSTHPTPLPLNDMAAPGASLPIIPHADE